MKRWIAAALAAAAVCLGATTALVAITPAAHAQSVAREVPADVRYARMQVLQTPVILLDEQPARLSPGARIRNPMNLLLLPASITGHSLPVVFRRDPAGLVHEVWVLTEAEAATLLRSLGPGTATGAPGGAPAGFLEALALVFSLRR
jgi:hypothetical protein